MRFPYPSYKPTTIPWLPLMPQHWELIGFNFLFRDNKEKNKMMKESLILSLSYGNIIRKRKEENFGLIPESFETYQILNPGYIVLRLTDLQNDKRSLRVGYVNERGIITSAYTGLVPNKVNSRYYYYFLHYLDIRKHFYSLGGGVRQSSDYNELKKQKFPFPPLSEQTAIVNYLDAKTEEIATFIAKKQKLIVLLREHKQAIIDELTSIGIDKSIKLKPSYINQLGNIPEHWQVRRIGTIGSFSKGGNISRSDLLSEGLSAILYGDIYTKYNYQVKEIVNKISEETAKNAVLIFRGDLLFTGSGELKEDIGKCIVYTGEDEVYAGGDIVIFRQKKFDSVFLSYSLNNSFSKFQKAIGSKGEIIVHTYASKLRNIYLSIPPLEEQKQIVKKIQTEMFRIDTIVNRIEKEIELVKVLKQSLVAEVVTGKIKVSQEIKMI